MYLWTATIAVPVTVAAFMSLWIAGAVAVFLLLVTLSVSRGPLVRKVKNAIK